MLKVVCVYSIINVTYIKNKYSETFQSDKHKY